MLPLLESTAGYAPVTFTVQEQHTPTNNPSSIVSTHYILSSRLDLHNTINKTFLSIYRSYYNNWYRNGLWVFASTVFSGSNLERLSLQITSNNSADVIGDYVKIAWIRYDNLLHCMKSETRAEIITYIILYSLSWYHIGVLIARLIVSVSFNSLATLYHFYDKDP